MDKYPTEQYDECQDARTQRTIQEIRSPSWPKLIQRRVPQTDGQNLQWHLPLTTTQS